MSAGANGKIILAATRELARKWDWTKTYWRDAKSEEFESLYLQELFGGVERASVVLDEIDQLIANAKKKGE